MYNVGFCKVYRSRIWQKLCNLPFGCQTPSFQVHLAPYFAVSMAWHFKLSMIFQEMIRVERRALVGVVCGPCAGQRSVTGFPVPRYSWPSHGSTSPVMPANALSNSAHSGEKRARFTKFEPEARLAFSCGQLLLAWHPLAPYTSFLSPHLLWGEPIKKNCKI